MLNREYIELRVGVDPWETLDSIIGDCSVTAEYIEVD